MWKKGPSLELYTNIIPHYRFCNPLGIFPMSKVYYVHKYIQKYQTERYFNILRGASVPWQNHFYYPQKNKFLVKLYSALYECRKNQRWKIWKSWIGLSSCHLTSNGCPVRQAGFKDRPTRPSKRQYDISKILSPLIISLFIQQNTFFYKIVLCCRY